MDGEEQRCRVGCPDEPDSLSHYNECTFLYNFVVAAWRYAAVRPRRGHLFHDLIIHTLLRSLQYGIAVVGVIDAFVYADNHHRRNLDNPGNFGDCIPIYAHAYQSFCVAGLLFVVFHQKFRLPVVKATYLNLPDSRTTTRDKGNDFQGWAIYTDGGTRSAEGETSAGWGAVARSPHGRLFIMFHLVITTEAHLAYAGTRHHSNKTAELSSIIKALSFLGPNGPVARDSQDSIFYDSRHAASICLGTVQSRANVTLGLTCQGLLLQILLRLRFTLQHIYSHAQNSGNECADHAAALGETRAFLSFCS